MKQMKRLSLRVRPKKKLDETDSDGRFTDSSGWSTSSSHDDAAKVINKLNERKAARAQANVMSDLEVILNRVTLVGGQGFSFNVGL